MLHFSNYFVCKDCSGGAKKFQRGSCPTTSRIYEANNATKKCKKL